VKDALDKAKLKPEIAEIVDEAAQRKRARRRRGGRMRSLLDALGRLDDVQDVYTTAVLD
jgi:transcriptional/translational regulatory protein YebC/TACO1